MTDTIRTPNGRFAPGSRGNPNGRPVTGERVRRAIEKTLEDAGATPDEIAQLAQVAGDSVRSAAVIAMLVATVTARAEQDTPSSPKT